jgi:hypothetical protein
MVALVLLPLPENVTMTVPSPCGWSLSTTSTQVCALLAARASTILACSSSNLFFLASAWTSPAREAGGGGAGAPGALPRLVVGISELDDPQAKRAPETTANGTTRHAKNFEAIV